MDPHISHNIVMGSLAKWMILASLPISELCQQRGSNSSYSVLNSFLTDI